MRTNGKILNDPIYGLIEIPYGIIFDLLEHRYYQRLRRISQLGFTHYVYPGATHTRFNHAIGALHLMQRAIAALQKKGINISEEEAEAACIAILLHDIGHGPFSHCLEFNIMQIHHEELSILFMEKLNEEFEGRLTMALAIFKNEHPKKFLHQLVSSQLDMDRMDYLNRDSFFTGVSEGVIGYDRIIKMFSVEGDQLVIEYKGLYSVEKFLIARRLMYWQVYLHKVVICAGELTIKLIQRARELVMSGQDLPISPNLHFFLSKKLDEKTLQTTRDEILYHFSRLDDIDILSAIKAFCSSDDFILSFLAKSLITRKLFRIKLGNDKIPESIYNEVTHKVMQQYPIQQKDLHYLVFTGQEANKAYDQSKEEIMIRLSDGRVRPISEWREHNIRPQKVVKYYICYPKDIEI
jgi:HD superfamily phosphohydrolase